MHAETLLIGHANCHLKWQALNAKDLAAHDCISIGGTNNCALLQDAVTNLNREKNWPTSIATQPHHFCNTNYLIKSEIQLPL